MLHLTIDAHPISARPFHGIGVEMDAYIFDEVNRACGVTDADLALLARRTRAMRPAVARLFVEVPWFNPSLDGTTLLWDQPGYLHLLRQLRLLQAIGTAVNLVLFLPMPSGDTPLDMPVRAMLRALGYLIETEGLTCIRWLTLWNEPDTLFAHDSPLYRRLFGEESVTTRAPWTEYVRLNRMAYAEMASSGLSAQVQLVVADTVWGAPMRMERLRLSLEAFGDLDVAYSVHNYSIEAPISYVGNEDFAYAGMAAEAAAFRALLGPERELILWEFNTVGLAGFNSMFMGVGPGGEDRVSSFAGAVDAADKVLASLANGIDGCCLWMLHDMVYCGSMNAGVMPSGLWRYGRQGWLPRPIYHYYCALMAAFQPGARLYRVQGGTPALRALARDEGDRQVLALLNTGATALTVRVPWQGTAHRLCLTPDRLPAECDLPLRDTIPLSVTRAGITLTLAPQELTIVSAAIEAVLSGLPFIDGSVEAE